MKKALKSIFEIVIGLIIAAGMFFIWGRVYSLSPFEAVDGTYMRYQENGNRMSFGFVDENTAMLTHYDVDRKGNCYGVAVVYECSGVKYDKLIWRVHKSAKKIAFFDDDKESRSDITMEPVGYYAYSVKDYAPPRERASVVFRCTSDAIMINKDTYHKCSDDELQELDYFLWVLEKYGTYTEI